MGSDVLSETSFPQDAINKAITDNPSTDFSVIKYILICLKLMFKNHIQQGKFIE
ncbi:hypothetical protein GCM10007962_09880 [Yeosuana aromativorans]|uniref:Uncharacterized protein n=1 Tax=Yeosuana aromativorans TaxID=288019 RepID=A0A8J3BF95_9FLAO|nr:hypothetical protein GCM10007962_09880 [Yeosuana aromativorans]